MGGTRWPNVAGTGATTGTNVGQYPGATMWHADRRARRPRLEQPRRPGRTARDEILDAAALHHPRIRQTSTRRIADAVGMRQASLYHHFATKDDILDALLAGTVYDALRLAADLIGESGSYVPRLHALVVADATQLCGSRWNLGARYLLPELRVERFEMFRLRCDELRRLYRQLSDGVIAESGGPPEADDLPFRLVESVINRRSDDGACAPDQPWLIADGALRVIGFDGNFAQVRRSTAERLGSVPVIPVVG